MNSLVEFLRKTITLPDEEEFKIKKIVRERTIPQGYKFVCEGEVPTKFAFVHEGFFRYYYLKEKGVEFTKSFITQGNFISAYSAMITEKPSPMFIEALTDSVLYEIHYSDWLVLRDGDPCWNQLLIKMLEKAFSIKEMRERELLLLDAKQRYKNFQRDFPEIERSIKQHLIASYLGISPVSLSRIRKKYQR